MHRGKQCAIGIILTAAVSLAAGTIYGRISRTHEMTLEEALKAVEGRRTFTPREKELLCGVFLRAIQRGISSMEKLDGEKFLKKLAEDLKRYQK